MPPLRWPLTIPNRSDSVGLLFDTRTLPEVVQARTATLIELLVTRGISEAPTAVDRERWHLVLATVFRLEAAIALAEQAKDHDEVALQELFHEAAEARDWLLELTAEAAFEPIAQVLALRQLLQASWDEVLSCSPDPKQVAAARAAVRSVPRKSEKKQAPTPFARAAGSTRNSAPRLALIAALVASLGMFWSFRPQAAVVATGGAPAGWILAGEMTPGPATVISATRVPHHRAELLAWLEVLRSQGLQVQAHGNDEWIVSNRTPEAGR